MQNEVYGFYTDVDGVIYYADTEQYLGDLKANELSAQAVAAAANEAHSSNKLIEARLNQKMTERMAQSNYQIPPAQVQAMNMRNTPGFDGLDFHGRPQLDAYDLRGARSVDTSPAGLMRNVTGRRGGRRRTIRL